MNYRISNNLFESIRNVTNPQVQEAEVDKAHFCATHVEHAMLGLGTCISEQHAEPDENGNIAWYTVEFPTGTHRIETSNLRIVEGKSHTHSKKMEEAEDNIEEGNDGNLANNAKPYDKITRGDVIAGRLGKDEMGGKKKVVKEEEKIDEVSHQAATTMKHIPNASPDLKKAAKDIKPGIAGYKDRVDMLKAGGVKEEAEEIDEATLSAKAGRAGKDLGKPGKNFEKIAASAGKKYGSKAAGERVAGAVLAKMRKEETELDEVKMADLPSRKIQGRSYGASKPEPSAFDILKGPRDKDLKSIATKKKPVKPFPGSVKEGITQTIINYDDFRIDVTDNPTYGDYLKALQTMVESRDESIQQEVVAIATAAYDEKIDSIIVESKARQLFAGKLDELRKSGAKVLDESYIVESDSTYVEYTVEKDGVRTQYVHIGTTENK